MLLKNLPKDTKVFCGHEYTKQNLRFAAMVEPDNKTVESYLAHLIAQPTHCSLPSTIALEKEINPFMRTSSQTVQRFAQRKKIDSKDSLAIFELLREEKNNFA